MISIDIKNILFTLFAKLVNTPDFNPKRLKLKKQEVVRHAFTILTIIKILFI